MLFKTSDIIILKLWGQFCLNESRRDVHIFLQWYSRLSAKQCNYLLYLHYVSTVLHLTHKLRSRLLFIVAVAQQLVCFRIKVKIDYQESNRDTLETRWRRVFKVLVHRFEIFALILNSIIWRPSKCKQVIIHLLSKWRTYLQQWGTGQIYSG